MVDQFLRSFYPIHHKKISPAYKFHRKTYLSKPICRHQQLGESYKYNYHIIITHVFLISRRTKWAALRPGAPITPPPGCAPLPHKYKPLSGVL